MVSTATLREVASWFDVSVDSARRRFRANLEVGAPDVPPFWEDRLVADHGEAVAFRVGEAELLGVTPCQRCVVPSRDPNTGAETPGFRERFLERRAATRPEWLDTDRFDHYFRLMVNTHVPESEVGVALSVGDPVEVLGTRSL
ncbi:MOSC domain-containing protein [Halomarina litorea]|uniref:MOSC domain-containing protein n=1 Tax=Halomarina litorea TaxID=2961595 RepID=UPI0034A2B204